MDIQINERNGIKFAQVISESIVINNLQDAVDLLGNVSYLGAANIVLLEGNLNDAFFDLKTGIAGDILQKYANYKMRLAIIGDFEKYKSNALNAFIIECNRGNSIYFVEDLESALVKIGM